MDPRPRSAIAATCSTQSRSFTLGNWYSTPVRRVGDPDGPEAVEPAVTTTMRLTPVIGVQRASSETVPRPELEPIFTELAARWETDGRLVPGRPDEEWTILARGYPWPGR